MRKFYLSIILLISVSLTQAQNNAANYAFATINSGSLTDMSTGTTQLIAGDQDDVASAITNFGFDFYFMGTRYAQFSVNTNGSIRLGTTAVSTTLYDPLGQAGQALITAYGADQRTHAGNGKIHYKLSGAAPNRVFIIEWLNMQADFNAGGTADLTYQVRLYETTGIIEFVYGSLTMSAAGAADANSSSPQFGFSSNNAVGTVGSITAAQSGTPAPTFSGASATPINNTFTAGAIPVLTSAANGSRRVFTLTSPIPNAAGGPLTFTGVGTTTTTLNWTDASNENGYAIYQSLNGTNYNYFGSAAQNATSLNATGLLSNTNYYWQVYSLSEGALSGAITASQSTIAPNLVKSVGTGLWSSPATWSTGIVPSIDDSVVISNGHTVTIDVAATVYAVTVGEGGAAVLQFEQTTARTLTVNSNVLIQAGATFQSNPAGTQTGHILSVGGNLINNGTLDFSTNADTAGAGITFTGPANATFSGTGITTDIRLITLNKGTSSASVLEITVTNFTVRGVTTDTVVGGFLVLTNGTFKISGSFTITSRMFSAAAYTIPATAGVWLNNPNVTIAAQNGNAVNNGLLRISTGTWNIGTLATATVTGAAAAMFTIDGGTVNIAGRFNPSTAVVYNQSGGVFNVAVTGNSGSGTANGSFTLVAAASFNFTGGTINLVQASTGATPIDYINSAPSVSSGGTLQAGTGATVTNFNFRLRGNIPNLVIDNTTNNKTATATAQINLNGTTLIKPGTTLVINGQICLVIGSTFTNNGTLTGTAASTRFYFLGGSGPTTYTGTGTVTAPLTAFEVDNIAGVTLDPAISQITVTRINNFSGGITNANRITLGNGGATTGSIQLGVAGVTQTVNGLDVPPVFNPGTGGINIFYAPELTGRTTGAELPPSRILNQLSISNPNPVTIAGGDLTTNTLVMAAGNIITGSNTLILGTSAAAVGTYTYTSGTIVGKFKRWIAAAAGNSDFPVGIATAKRNASVNFTTAPSTGGTLTAQWVNTAAGTNGLPLTEGSIVVTTASSAGYWSVVAGDGLTGGVYTGTFTATAIPNIVDITQLVLLKRPNSVSPWILDGTHVTATGTTAVPVLSRTGMIGFSEFGIGSSAVNALPVTLLNFSGHRNANDNVLNWNTASEQNNAGFEVQRSANGTDYKKIGFVNTLAPGGNSTGTLYYSFTDNKPDGLVQYYRLKQVNTDNEFKYSSIVILKQDKPLLFTINSVYPNPVFTTAALNISSMVNDRINLVITDMSGRKLSEQTAVVAAGNNSVSVDVNKLPAGAYIITVTCMSGSCGKTSASFIKH